MTAKSGAVFLILMTLAACTPQNQLAEADLQHGQPVIWNDDTREDVSIANEDSQLVQATAVLVRDYRLQKDSAGDFIFRPRPLSSAYPLCADEKFVNQSLLGHCSGVLIGPRQVLTAGHCVPEDRFCGKTYLTFGYTLGKTADAKIKSSEVYRCQQVVKRVLDGFRDYAVIELDRDVTQAVPVKIGSGDKIKENEDVLSLSYPFGLPLKRDLGKAKTNQDGGYFLFARVDTFSGSSGSPLFNSQHELVGILTKGADDFDKVELEEIQNGTKPKTCIRARRCTDSDCKGEQYLKMEGIELP